MTPRSSSSRTYLPQRFEVLGATLENAARLHAAGVSIAFGNASGGGAGRADPRARANLRAGAGRATRPGFDADVVVWDGDPLEVTSFPDAVFIKGAEVPMESRHTLLRDRYMERLKLR
jgi:imidazolonepropionase-like amidohydrolase